MWQDGQNKKKKLQGKREEKVRGKPIITVYAREKHFLIMLMIYTNIRVTNIYFHSINFVAKWHEKGKKVQQPLWKLYSKTQRKGYVLFFFSPFFSYFTGACIKKNPWLCSTGGLLRRWVWQTGWEGLYPLHTAQQGQVCLWELGLNEDRYQHHCWKLQGWGIASCCSKSPSKTTGYSKPSAPVEWELGCRTPQGWF